MKILFILFLVPLSPLLATHLVIFGEKNQSDEQKQELFDLILKGEPPRTFYDSNPIDLNTECHKLDPSIRLEWIPPSLWQLGVLYTNYLKNRLLGGIESCRQID